MNEAADEATMNDDLSSLPDEGEPTVISDEEMK